MTSRIVRWRSVRPVAPRRVGVLPGAPVLSFMAVNLAGIRRIIKHVFERVGCFFWRGTCRSDRGAGDGPDLSVL